MRKRFTILLAAMLCLCLGLTACGSQASEESESSATEAEVTNPAEKFYGTWQLATISSSGLTMVGDFSQLIDVDINMVLTIADDNTATMTFDGDTANLTWETVDDNTLKLSAVKDEETDDEEAVLGEDGTIEVAYRDDTLVMESESDGQLITITFTTDGTLEGYEEITADNAKPFTSKDELVGTWNMCGLNMYGVSMFGNMDDLAAAFSSGTNNDYTLVLNEDGSATLFGAQASWKAADEGATLTAGDTKFTLFDYDGKVLINMSGASADYQMLMLFEK